MDYSSHLEKRNPWGIFRSNGNALCRTKMWRHVTLGTASILNVICKPNSAAGISKAVNEKSTNSDEASDEEKGKGTEYNYKIPSSLYRH